VERRAKADYVIVSGGSMVLVAEAEKCDMVLAVRQNIAAMGATHALNVQWQEEVGRALTTKEKAR